MNLKIIAKYISYIFIPPVMNFLIFLVFSFEIENTSNKWLGILISFLFGLLIPVITILKFKNYGVLSDYDATIKEERLVPYIYAIGYSMLGVIFSSLIGLNENLIMLWMVYVFISIFIININHFWKISAHAMGATVPIGALSIIEQNQYYLIFIVIFLMVANARLILKVHTLSQVIMGGIIGYSTAYILLNYCW